MRCVALFVSCLIVTGLVVADTPPCTQVEYAGEVILRMRCGVGDQTPQQRAVLVHRQLTEAMAAINASRRPFEPRSVVVRRVCGGPYRHEVRFGRLRLVGVTQADANANGCCTQQLAAHWAAHIRRALDKATHDC